MINIISTCANKNKVSGPGKVFQNLQKGLEKIKYPYVINRDINATTRLWIHDHVEALKYLPYSKAHTIIGPNLFVLPSDIPIDIKIPKNILYLHPCEWPIDFFKTMGFHSCDLHAWPVGIDTEQFQPSTLPANKRKILVYHKQRDSQELAAIIKILHERDLAYNLVIYGQYTETEYKSILDHTSMILWHGSHESQGIALQEALACNIPIMVINATSVLQYAMKEEFPAIVHNIPVTSAPYFDQSCGIIINTLNDINDALTEISDNLSTYSPREFVLKNLSLEKQAIEFVKLWERWGMSYEEGFSEPLKNKEHLHKPTVLRAQNVVSKIKSKLLSK